jgi:hypothetical protein
MGFNLRDSGFRLFHLFFILLFRSSVITAYYVFNTDLYSTARFLPAAFHRLEPSRPENQADVLIISTTTQD